MNSTVTLGWYKWPSNFLIVAFGPVVPANINFGLICDFPSAKRYKIRVACSLSHPDRAVFPEMVVFPVKS